VSENPLPAKPAEPPAPAKPSKGLAAIVRWFRRRSAPIIVGTHLLAAGIGAAIPLTLSITGFPLEMKKQSAELAALDSFPFEVVDTAKVEEAVNLPHGERKYFISYAISEKNENDTNIQISWQIFSAYLLEIKSNSLTQNRSILLSNPPDPLEDQSKNVPVSGSPELSWNPITCIKYLDTGERKVKSLLDKSKCGIQLDGGGMTGTYPPRSTNTFLNRIIIVAKPGSFVALSVAFGVNDCVNDDSPYCDLSQAILLLP